MAATAFPAPGFAGPADRFPPGIFHGDALRDLAAFAAGGARSLRVDPGTLVLLGPGPSPPRRGGRFVAGPAEVPDVALLGLPGGFGFLQVVPFRPYSSARPPGLPGALLHELPGFAGRRAGLWWGDYGAARLASREVGLPAFESLEVAAGAVVVLSAGGGLEPGADALLFVGPARVPDLPRLGLAARSLRVAYADPFDLGAAGLGRPWLREFFDRPPRPPGLHLGAGGFLPPRAPRGPAPAPGPASGTALSPAPPEPQAPFVFLGFLAAALVGAACAGGGAAGRRAAGRRAGGRRGPP